MLSFYMKNVFILGNPRNWCWVINKAIQGHAVDELVNIFGCFCLFNIGMFTFASFHTPNKILVGSSVILEVLITLS